jgi:hypothetical protein
MRASGEAANESSSPAVSAKCPAVVALLPRRRLDGAVWLHEDTERARCESSRRTQMISAHLQFEAVSCLQAVGRRHHSCVVEKDIAAVVLGRKRAHKV